MSQLSRKVYEVAAKAKQLGTFHPINTKTVIHEEEQTYYVRIAVGAFLKPSTMEQEVEKSSSANGDSNKTEIQRKEEEKPKIAKDPFRPTDQTLFVQSIPPKHSLLLNKFMVIPEHLLIITDEFESQTDHLNIDDIKAACNVFNQLDIDQFICFYNRGLFSGCSQPHKHVQLIPRKERNETTLEWKEDEIFPLPKLFDENVKKYGKDLRFINEFNFIHQIRSISHCFKESKDELEIATKIYNIYIEMLKELDIYDERKLEMQENEPTLNVECLEGEMYSISLCAKRFPSYNVLFSNQWLLIVPRRNENYKGISCNSLAFLHGFFCKDDQIYQNLINEIQIPKLLEYVTFPKKN
ncbi:hypothetical protein ABK040_004872 [Willaertia magna]